MSKRRRWFWTAVSVLFAFVLAETGLWLYEVASSDPDSPGARYDTTFLASDGATPIAGTGGPLKYVHDPFVNYRNLPNQQTESFRINARGYRGPELGPDGAKPRIILVGGSAAFGWGLDSDDETLTAALEREFPEIEAVNAAVVGHVSTDELAMVKLELLDLNPTLVVALDGFNDAMMGRMIRDRTLAQNYFFEFTETTMATAAARSRNPLLALLSVPMACFPRTTTQLRRLERLPHRIRAQMNGGIPETDEELFRTRRPAYVANMRRMDEACRRSGARLLVLLQPQRPRPWLYSDFYAKLYSDFVAEVETGLNESGIEHINLHAAQELQGEHFFDDVHMNGEGNRIIAALAAKLIRERGMLGGAAVGDDL